MKEVWPIIPLGQALEISAERILPSTQPGVQFNYVGLEHIESHTGRILTRDFTLGSEIKSTKNVFHPGLVLYGKLRPYLNKVHLAYREGICSTDVFVLRPNPGKVNASFTAYYLRSSYVLSRVNDLMQGANLPRLSPSSFLRIPIPLPPLPEQHRIVNLLDEADELRRRREQADRRTADLIPALFCEMFGDPVVNPKKWSVWKLGRLIVNGPQNGLYKHSSFYGNGTPILRINSFYNGRVNSLAGLQRVRLDVREVALYLLKENDIVINRVNSPDYLGKSTLIPKMIEPTVFESNMMRFSTDSSQVDPLFLITYLQTEAIKKQIRTKAKHAIHQSSINQGDVESFSLWVPALALQHEFAARVGQIRALESRQAESRRRLDDLFQSMLHRAFQGEL